MPLPIQPQKIGPYRLLYPLGKGGSSEVFAARGPWDTKVALKVQRTALKKRSRFLQEFDVPNVFHHPCVNLIFAYGMDPNGWSYLVMDLVEGAVSAAAYAKQFSGGKRIEVVLDISIQIAEALAVFHQNGWIHGDIKSKNILIDKYGCPYLIDFELARTLQSTGRGNFFGTRSYAPPEQHEGKRLTPSADVYALAGVICRMLSGSLPFPKESKEKQAANRRSLAPKIPGNIPANLSKVLRAALNPNPAQRPENGLVFANLLRANSQNKTPHQIAQKEVSLRDIWNILQEYKLRPRHQLPHLCYFSGGLERLAALFAREMQQKKRWVPHHFIEQWQQELAALPLETRHCLVVLVALGGQAKTSLLAAILGKSNSKIRQYLVTCPTIVEKRVAQWRLKFGALDSTLLNMPFAAKALQGLKHPQTSSTPQGRIALHISQGQLEKASTELQSWITEQADSLRQWIFTQRLIRWRFPLSKYQKILLFRWEGNWRGALKQQQNPHSAQILQAIQVAQEGSLHAISELSSILKIKQIDTFIAVRVLLAEWHVSNGRFHDALQKLKVLCQHKDFYPRHVGLQQRAMIHCHLGQKAKAREACKKLSKWATSIDQLRILQQIEDGKLFHNYLPLEHLNTPYLSGFRSLLTSNRIGTSLLRQIRQTLSLHDRSTLLSNPIWRPYEKSLGLPSPPAKDAPNPYGNSTS